MRTHTEALKYSQQNPTELVEFKNIGHDGVEYWTGYFLNGEREGLFDLKNHGDILIQRDVFNSKTQHAEHLHFRDDGSISRHFFRQCDLIHGEFKRFNEDGLVVRHQFYNSSIIVKELDYLIHEERDDAFYFTLSLCGITKEYIFK